MALLYSMRLMAEDEKMAESMFTDFVGEEVKVPYRDGDQFKIARGILTDVQNGFVKIVGNLGTIIINEKNIERMSKIRDKM